MGLLSCCWALTIGMLGELPNHSAVWSPDGSWMAYVLATRPTEQALASDWLYQDAAQAPEARAAAGRTYRLWATRIDTHESVLLAESAGPLTAPTWKPDGPAIAYGRVSLRETGAARYEVLVQDTLTEPRVLASWELEGPNDSGRFESLANTGLSWGPDGRYLIVPQLQPVGLVVLRAETGQRVKFLEGGFSPSWSRDGSHLAYYKSDGLYWIDSAFGEPKVLVKVPNADGMPAPLWSRDGQNVLAVVRGSRRGWGFRFGRRGGDPDQPSLSRIWIDAGRVDGLMPIFGEAFADPDSLRDLSMAQVNDGSQVLLAVKANGEQSRLLWVFPGDREVNLRELPTPVDESTRIGSVATSPADRLELAVRVGTADGGTVVGLIDPNVRQITPLVPDADARLEWVALLVDTARSVLAGLPARRADGATVPRATLLPASFELDRDPQAVSRLAHLARLGKSLCEPGPDASSIEAPIQARLDQARLFFAYLSLDHDHPGLNYQEAREAVGVVESSATDPDTIERLLVLRAQIAYGLGEGRRAGSILGYLRQIRPERVRVIEQTATGQRLTQTVDPLLAWSDHLEKAPAAPASAAHRTDPLGNVNFDAPRPGLGLDPEPVIRRFRPPFPPAPDGFLRPR